MVHNKFIKRTCFVFLHYDLQQPVSSIDRLERATGKAVMHRAKQSSRKGPSDERSQNFEKGTPPKRESERRASRKQRASSQLLSLLLLLRAVDGGKGETGISILNLAEFAKVLCYT